MRRRGWSAHLSAVAVKGRVLKIEHDGIRARATGGLSSDECGNLVSVRLWAAAVGRELWHACSRAEDAM